MHKTQTLYDKVSSAENVLLAAHHTLKHGRRFKNAGASFKFSLEREVIAITKELQSQTYQPGHDIAPKQPLSYVSRFLTGLTVLRLRDDGDIPSRIPNPVFPSGIRTQHRASIT